jgi:hypothetical protein
MKWLRQDLNRGDLNTLREISKGRMQPTDTGAVARLEMRGFVAIRKPVRITLLGRVALFLRRRARKSEK